MGKTLVLAEKPSVGRELARVLGCTRSGNGCLEGDRYIVTWALGHLVTLAACMGGSYALCARMPGGWLGLVPRILVVLVVPNALNLAVYGWGKDAAYLRQYAGKVAKKLLKK